METIERPRPRSGSGSGSQDTLHDDGGESRELCRLHLASRAVRCDALLPPTKAPRRAVSAAASLSAAKSFVSTSASDPRHGVTGARVLYQQCWLVQCTVSDCP